MTTTDPIADMLARIRNAIAVGRNEISLPHSKLKESVAVLLKDTGFINNVKATGSGVDKAIEIVIFANNQSPKITEIQRLSKPGRRMYSKADQIPAVKRGRGIVVVSTSRGVMTGDEAKKQRLGGELICKVF